MGQCIQDTYKENPNETKPVQLIFFARTFGRETESAKHLLNLLDLLTVDNIYRLEVLKFTYSWHNGLLPDVFDNICQYARNIPGYNTRYAAKPRILINIKLKLMQGSNQFLTWQLISGKTFHLL